MVSKTLKRKMAELGLTAEQLAARIQTAGGDTTYGTVQGWISGRRTPSLGSARFLAAALGCTTDELYDREEAVA